MPVCVCVFHPLYGFWQLLLLPLLMQRDLIDLSNFPLLLIKFANANFLQSVDSYRSRELGVLSAKLN